MSERIAVIIPCYNHAAYIGEALDSVLAQTRPADRILVIDDGSTDNSVEVLTSYASRGVDMWRRNNMGAHHTLNELVEIAAEDCDFVQILNSDDRLLPGRLELCMKLLGANPGKSVFSSGLQVIDGEGHLMPEDAPRSRWFHGAWNLGHQEGSTLASWLGQANFIATTSNVLARTSYLKRYPFRPYRFNHDYFFLSTAVLQDQLAVSADVQVEYRVHGSNTIATRPEPLIREMLRLHLDLYREHGNALGSDAAMRQRFYEYLRGSWNSISSLHPGLVQVGLAQFLAQHSEEEIEQISAALSGSEFDAFPNRVLAASSTEEGLATLSKKVESLKSDLEKAKEDRQATDQLARLRQLLLSSRWVQFGLALGLAGKLAANRGKTPVEKLANLQALCQSHSWLKLGASFGSKRARELRSS